MQNKQSNGPIQRSSGRYIVKDDGVLLKKSEKLVQSSKQKRQIAPDKLKQMRQVFTTISNSQLSKNYIFISLKNFYSSAC
jgi:hypothetical protein